MTKPESLEDLVPRLWDGLVREINPENIEEMIKDTKVPADGHRLYVPQENLEQARSLFPKIKVQLPAANTRLEPGLLSLAWDVKAPLSYCVPGGRFNEVYGWDTYFIVLGLLESGRFDLARNMLLHHCYEIQHYGMVLNANRSYYLNRSQPPFLTDMALRIYEAVGDRGLLRLAMERATQEYHQVWASEPRLDPVSGLSRYSPPRTNQIPIEVEPGHFDSVLAPYAAAYGLDIPEFSTRYNSGLLECPELDTFLHHDLGVRESGHDTSTRLYNVCADLATVDLNSLLYKYERDLAEISRILGLDPTSWEQRSQARKSKIMQYMWNEGDSIFYDYNTASKSQHRFPSATCLYTLWAGLCPRELAPRLVSKALELFEQPGGIVTTQPLSDLPNNSHRQWDYPTGWAPHQILAWKGLYEYGFKEDASRLASHWVEMIRKVWNAEGLVFEKYNVVDRTHGVEAEYGNQGTFKEGFGWTNASILLARHYTHGSHY